MTYSIAQHNFDFYKGRSLKLKYILKGKNGKDGKDGTVTLMIILVFAILLPLFFFVFVEINHYWTMKYRYQEYNNLIAQSAIIALDSTQLTQGNLVITKNDAYSNAQTMLKKCYSLDSNLNITSQSSLKKNPMMKIYVINDVDEKNGTIFKTDEGYTITVYHPTVIVYTEIYPTGIFFNFDVKFPSITAYQVNFNKSSTSFTLDNNPVTYNGISLWVDNVVNPQIYNPKNPFIPKQWTFSSLLLLRNANITLSVAAQEVNNAYALIKILGTNSDGSTYLNNQSVPLSLNSDTNRYAYTYTIPKDAPIGSKLSVNIEIEKGTTSYFPAENSYSEIGTISGDINKVVEFQKAYF